MKHALTFSALVVSLCFAGAALAHDLGAGGGLHSHTESAGKAPERFFAQLDTSPPKPAPEPVKRPVQAAAFAAFAPRVSVRWDARFLFVESNGLPAHNMMVGITNWQQQVPLPQKYSGANAWQIPLVPVPAKEPLSIKGRFLRGAIALAANGVPIFNPQNNRGEVAQEIGELDEWGGHCGRADDYHYHAAPLHLQDAVGKGQPIAYALDGYAIYGLAEADGSAPAGLDAFNGHTTAALGYHYHASKKYPYVNGGFHGEVTEREQQVDPQPRAQPVRQDQPPLRGAKITGFTPSADGTERRLVYAIGGKTGGVNYTDAGGGAWKFEFVGADGAKTAETYQAREDRGGGGPGGPRPEGERPPRPDGARAEQGPVSSAEMDALKKPNAAFVLSSPEIPDPKQLPVEFTGDGAGVSPPLVWKGAPAETKSFAVVMDHLAPGNVVKSYWTLWDLPATTTSLPRNARDIGKLGASFRGGTGYEPPHSQGPGAKTYIITLYALSAAPAISQPAREVTREALLAAIKDKVLASASLPVTYTRDGTAAGPQDRRPPRPADAPPK